jgi:hypothetical protein
MSNARTRRKVKRAHRNTARMKRRDQPPVEPTGLADFVRLSLAHEHPLDFLGLVSLMIQTLTPDRYTWLRADSPAPAALPNFVDNCIAARDSERTALLAALAEMLEDDALRELCRREVARRDEVLPLWIQSLADVEAYRAVRMSHVLGDRDELLIGMRLGEFDLTCAVNIDHYSLVEITDAVVLPDPLDVVLADAEEEFIDGDLRPMDLSLADARAWIAHGLESSEGLRIQERANWPRCRPLVRWLIGYLPEGGKGYQEPVWDPQRSAALFADFFASPAGLPFDHRDTRELLSALCEETGNGDPLQWSALRVTHVADCTLHGYDFSVGTVLELPKLLKAYVPFAHARGGIREGLTADALAAIDGIQGRVAEC